MKRLERLGLFENALFVVTADHGMTAQDRRQPDPLRDVCRRAGVEAVASSERFVYLKCVEVSTSLAALATARSNDLVVSVRDDDHDGTNVRPSILDAAVTIEAGSRRWTARTDMAGEARFDVTPPAGVREVRIVVEASGYTRAERRLPVR